MYLNGKLRLKDTIPGRRVGRLKENVRKGEFKYDI
jgi:hypothetical protein